jgi:hypothetical protein
MPASVGVKPVVERSSSRTPTQSSNCEIAFETAGWPIFWMRAAAEKEPVSTTRTKVSIASSLSNVFALFHSGMNHIRQPAFCQ